ncbi:hypothetical protein JKP88DRAFT_265685 [Tribonema minus]|uniref:Uncharacterized protein n=1 Tax=Tribonema minus TaxID=303371 RepID=A0A835YLM0_9STRA|nr:hypothetical protein JKP88DRAFT_265685 [Tribonema minus]
MDPLEDLREVDLDEETPRASRPPKSPPSPNPRSPPKQLHMTAPQASEGSHSARALTARTRSASPRAQRHVTDEVAPGRDDEEDTQATSNAYCNLNLGGPGWFTDVLTVTVELANDSRVVKDSPALSLVPAGAFQRWAQLVDAAAPMVGNVVLRAPSGRSVWISTLRLAIEEHLVLLESGSDLLCSAGIDVAPAQYIDGAKSFPFVLNIDALNRGGGGGTGLREGYVGDMLALRHRLVVTAARPWYTFDVVTQVPIVVQRVVPPPQDADSHAYGPQNEEGGPNTLMILPDCNGRAEFAFERDALDIDGELVGTVAFTDVVKALSGVHVVMIRTEILAGNLFESIVGEHTILGRDPPGAPAYRPPPGQTPDETTDPLHPPEDLFIASPYVDYRHPRASSTAQLGAASNGPFIGSGTLPVRVPLAHMPLSPTMAHLGVERGAAGGGDTSDDDEEQVGVRYYVRLIIEEQPLEEEGGQRPTPVFWNTHEVFLFRSRLRAGGYESDSDADGATTGGYEHDQHMPYDDGQSDATQPATAAAASPAAASAAQPRPVPADDEVLEAVL